MDHTPRHCDGKRTDRHNARNSLIEIHFLAETALCVGRHGINDIKSNDISYSVSSLSNSM